MRRRIVLSLTATAIAVAGLAACDPGSGARNYNLPSYNGSAMHTVIGTPGSAVAATFQRKLNGRSQFVSTNAGALEVYGQYAGLPANSPFFTVIYGNGNCDPAQAFPVGPFYTDANGRATFAANVPLPATVNVGQTGSASVRMGDTLMDIDKDGKVGPTDVVAVPGTPSIGLVECDYNPNVANLGN